MGDSVLDRYPRGAAGEVVIEVTAERAEALFDGFTKQAPYARRDLDPQLADYLVECAREVGRAHPLEIRIALEVSPEAEERARVLSSVAAYFHYLVAAERRLVRRSWRRMLGMFVAGLTLLTVMVWIKLRVLKAVAPSEPSLLNEVLVEGLTIVAWVIMWEALAMFLMAWTRRRTKVKLFEHLAAAKLTLAPRGQGADDPGPTGG